jgi:hypothetical protein
MKFHFLGEVLKYRNKRFFFYKVKYKYLTHILSRQLESDPVANATPQSFLKSQLFIAIPSPMEHSNASRPFAVLAPYQYVQTLVVAALFGDPSLS